MRQLVTELADDFDNLSNAFGNSLVKEPLCKALINASPGARKIIDEVGIDNKQTTYINLAIQKYRAAKANKLKAKKPKLEIGACLWVFDKIEEGRALILNDGTILLLVQEGDTLSENNEFKFDDNQQTEDIQESKLADELNQRDEITLEYNFELNKSYRVKYKFCLPEDFPMIDNRLVIGQIKQRAKDGVNPNPLICQRFRDGIYYTTFNNSGDPTGNGKNEIRGEQDAKVLRGRWVEIQYDIKFSEGNDGYIVITQDGKELQSYKGRVSSSSVQFPVGEQYEGEFFFKFGLYMDVLQKRLRELFYQRNTLMQEGTLAENGNKDIVLAIEKEIVGIKRAIKMAKEGNAMSIFFKDFSLEEVEEKATDKN